MKRTTAALLALTVIAAATGAISRTADAPVAEALRPARVIQSSGNDVSAPLAGLEGRDPGTEEEREAEREREEHEREAEREADAPESEDDDADEGAPAGDRPTVDVEKVRENARRPIDHRESHRPDGALQRRSNSPQTPTAAAAVGTAIPATTTNFDGINASQSVCSCYPPDTNAEVGPNHVVETVNTAIAVYSKTGVLAAGFPKPINAIWSGFNAGPACRDNNDGDPVVMYDALADRWVVTQFALPGFTSGAGLNYECIAVSTTSDPTGAYNRYQFSYTSGLLNDYPKFAVWPDGYYATYNNFTSPAGAWAGPGVAAYDRAKMIAGQPASVVQFNIAPNTNEGGLLPTDLDGSLLPPAGAPNPIVQMQDTAFGFAQDQLMIRRFHVDFTTPANSTLSAPTVLPVAAYDPDLCGFGLCIPQPGTGQLLDSLSDRIMYRASYRNLGDHDSLLVNASVDVTGTDVAGIRWAEVANATSTTPGIVQQSTYAPDNTNRWMGSIAQDRDGNIALGYSASSSTVSPSLRYTGRLADDPLGQMTQGEATLVAGAGSQTGTGGRWGDYSNLSVDPTDDCTFWFSSEYYTTTSLKGWRTRIGSFKFPTCGASALPTISVGDVSVVEGNTGTKTISIPFTLSAAQPTPVSFTYATANGTATAGSDYTARTTTKVFNAGETAITTAITISGDVTVEPNETFSLNLSNPVGATFADNQGVVTITNDDVAGTPLITINDVAIREGNAGTKVVSVTFKLSKAAATNVSFKYTTSNGTAVSGSDYTARTLVKTFTPGVTTVTTNITIIGDTRKEANETFSLKLSNAVGGVIADSKGVVTITNDD